MKIDRETAQADLMRFGSYMGVDFSQDPLSGVAEFNLRKQELLNMICDGRFTVDESGRGTYSVCRTPPVKDKTTFVFEEPDGRAFVQAAKQSEKQGGIPIHGFTAYITGVSVEVLQSCKSKDLQALTNVGRLCTKG